MINCLSYGNGRWYSPSNLRSPKFCNFLQIFQNFVRATTNPLWKKRGTVPTVTQRDSNVPNSNIPNLKKHEPTFHASGETFVQLLSHVFPVTPLADDPLDAFFDVGYGVVLLVGDYERLVLHSRDIGRIGAAEIAGNITIKLFFDFFSGFLQNLRESPPLSIQDNKQNLSAFFLFPLDVLIYLNL